MVIFDMAYMYGMQQQQTSYTPIIIILFIVVVIVAIYFLTGSSYQTCSDEDGGCRIDQPSQVYFYSQTNSNPQINSMVRTAMPGKFICSNSTFGRDPASGEGKKCTYKINPNPYVDCAVENGSCVLPDIAEVSYYKVGTNPYENNMTLLVGKGMTLNCSNTEFGGDPAPGNGKTCSYKLLN